MKKCIACEETKALTEFYKTKNNLDGHLGRCKECYKNDIFPAPKVKEPMR